MGGPTGTDHITVEEFRKRAKEQIQQGWEPILPKQIVVVTPAFKTNFDAFAAEAAHTLRRFVVYRSDGGKFARGLVRTSGDLEKIHKSFRDQGIADGTKVTLAAALYRRKHSEPTSRYMMSVRFAIVAISESEAEVINASADHMAKVDAVAGARILEFAAQAGKEPKWSGDRKKRIADWAELARKVGYPKYLELWHYNEEVVSLFVQYQNFHLHKRMTGGKPPPYDGHYGGRPWRIYPFKLIFDECKKRTLDECYALTANQLALSERNVLKMINNVWKATIKMGSAHSQDYRGGSVTGSAEAKFQELAPFMRDLKKQLDDLQSLMGTYMKYEQHAPGLFDGY